MNTKTINVASFQGTQPCSPVTGGNSELPLGRVSSTFRRQIHTANAGNESAILPAENYFRLICISGDRLIISRAINCEPKAGFWIKVKNPATNTVVVRKQVGPDIIMEFTVPSPDHAAGRIIDLVSEQKAGEVLCQTEEDNFVLRCNGVFKVAERLDLVGVNSLSANGLVLYCSDLSARASRICAVQVFEIGRAHV